MVGTSRNKIDLKVEIELHCQRREKDKAAFQRTEQYRILVAVIGADSSGEFGDTLL